MSALAVSQAPVAAPLTFADLSKAGGDDLALREISLAAPRGAITALVGPSGSGKSLLLRIALGLVRPDAGRVRVLDRDPSAGPAAERRRLRARLGAVWPGGALFADRDVAGNVGFALREVQGRPRVEVERAVRESLLMVGLKHVEHLRVDALAPGVRIRVALARAVAHRPELLLLDEPAGALDPVGAAVIRELVVQLRDRLALTVLVASRAPAWAFPMAEHVAVLHAGRIAAQGAPEAVRSSADEAVQQLLAGRAHGPIEP